MKQFGLGAIGFGAGLLLYGGWVWARDRGARDNPSERRALLLMLGAGVVLVALGIVLFVLAGN